MDYFDPDLIPSRNEHRPVRFLPPLVLPTHQQVATRQPLHPKRLLLSSHRWRPFWKFEHENQKWLMTRRIIPTTNWLPLSERCMNFSWTLRQCSLPCFPSSINDRSFHLVIWKRWNSTRHVHLIPMSPMLPKCSLSIEEETSKNGRWYFSTETIPHRWTA